MAEGAMRIQTEPVSVRVFTLDFEIEGQAHVKPGGYTGRVTDVLNTGKAAFIPLTSARYRPRSKGGEFVASECVVVRIGTIEIVEFI